MVSILLTNFPQIVSIIAIAYFSLRVEANYIEFLLPISWERAHPQELANLGLKPATRQQAEAKRVLI